jgi:nitrogen fixation protein FixH
MKELKGRHVLILLLSFFAVTVAVNAAMATYAIATFSGEDIPNPYLQGLAYNKTLRAQQAQNALGWSATIAAVREDGKVKARVMVRDRSGNAISGLTVSLKLRRPTDARLDRTVALAPAEGGHAASVADLAPGVWDAVAVVRSPDGEAFEATRRVVLP